MTDRVAVVLAAGHGRRFGGGKLMASFRGKPLLSHAIAVACQAPVSRVIVVARAETIVEAPPGAPPVDILRIESDALSQTLQAGIAASSGAGSAFVLLGDMPLIPARLAYELADAIGDNYAALPVCEGRPGHPVLLSARALADIATLDGDEGAGRLLRNRDDVAHIECDDPGCLFDIDRPDDLLRDP